MARSPSVRPTEFELAILKIMWMHSPRTVEDIRAALARAGRDLTHSSVITVMNIMVRKQYLRRTKVGRSFEFEPLVEERNVNRRLLDDLVNRVFDGSAKAVVLELLETSDVGADELAEVRRLIDKRRKERGS
jgi:BlaI family transcriptional regulator, penicillinase repressor